LRSVTSPSAPNAHQHLSPALSHSAVDEYGEPFSDDDMTSASSRGYNSSSSSAIDKTFSLENMIRPLKEDTRSRIRSGMRRLTGGGGGKDGERTREAVRLALQKSPQVPKVPDIWLVNPKSADP
jgi:hypothetical protein